MHVYWKYLSVLPLSEYTEHCLYHLYQIATQNHGHIVYSPIIQNVYSPSHVSWWVSAMTFGEKMDFVVSHRPVFEYSPGPGWKYWPSAFTSVFIENSCDDLAPVYETYVIQFTIDLNIECWDNLIEDVECNNICSSGTSYRCHVLNDIIYNSHGF